MPIVVLCVGIAETGGASPPPTDSRPRKRFIGFGNETGAKVVGVATITLHSYRDGHFQEVSEENLETYSICVAISYRPDPKISSGVFLEICWQNCVSYLQSQGIPQGIYSVEMVGFVQHSERGDKERKSQVSNRSICIRWGDNPQRIAKLPRYPWQVEEL